MTNAMTDKSITVTYLFDYEEEGGDEGSGEEIDATGITLNYKNAILMTGGKTTLKATLTPSNATTAVTWISSNPTVATVSDKGVVTAISPGKTVITAQAGKLTATCNLTVELTPTFKKIELYANADDYENGKEPYAMTPEFVSTTYTGYSVEVADYVNSFYLVGYPADDLAEYGYNNNIQVPTYQYGAVSFKTVRYSTANGVFRFSDAYPLNGSIPVKFASNIKAYEIQVKQYNTLSALTVSGTLDKSFDSETYSYHSWVDSDAENVSLSLVTTNSAASATVDGQVLASNQNYTFNNWDTDGKITLNITLTRSGCTSKTYTVVFERRPADTNAPVITEQPKSAIYVVNEIVDALTVNATSDGEMSYQWYSCETDSTSDGTLISGATASSYTPSSATVGTKYYYCVVTNTDETTGNTSTSEKACISVVADPTPVVTVSDFGSTMPDDGYKYSNNIGYYYNAGESAKELKVTAVSTHDIPLTYQWYKCNKKTDWTTNEKIEGAVNATYTPSTSANIANDNGIFYVCKVTATFNNKEYSAYSDGIYVFVKSESPCKPEFTLDPQGASYEVGEVVVALSANVSAADGGVLTYQWYANNVNSTEGAKKLEGQTDKVLKFSDTATTEDDLSDTYYYCVATNTLQGKSVSTNSAIALIRIRSAADIIGDVLKGKGTKEEPFQIWTAQDYQSVYDFVANGKSFDGLYLKQMENIELPQGWKPIGITLDGTNKVNNASNLRAFSGYLDGNGKLLTVPEGGLPLLGYVKGAQVHNLNIYGTKIAGYGLVNNLTGVGLKGTAIVIDGVTLKSGSSTLYSGLIGTKVDVDINWYAGCSADFLTVIRNCTIEEGVVVGYDGSQTEIGGIVGRMHGTIENCVCNATVKGKSYVGGIVGTIDNVMGGLSVTGCSFGGMIDATGSYVGGIVGGGYDNQTAPNGGCPIIVSCNVSGTIKGNDRVGGIFGGDGFLAQCWESDSGSISLNNFTGKIESDGQYVGAIIGYLKSLNKYNTIENNTYYADCGAESGIGFVWYLDTDYLNPTVSEGTVVINTGNGLAGLPSVAGCSWRENHNRTDDPLGKDKETLAKAVKSDKMLASEVDALIDEIETPITLGSKESVRKARKAYDALTPAQKNLVENYEALERAENELSPFMIQEVEDLINALPKKDEITLNDKEAIEEARAAYDELTKDEQKEISKDTLKKLTDAEKAYEKLVPKTGDNYNVFAYGAVLMLSVLALTGIMVYKKRKSM